MTVQINPVEAAGLMIDLPHRGNQLVVTCFGCGRARNVSGREIATKFTKWLRATVGEWASTLVCAHCQCREIMVYALADPGAQGFIHSTGDTGQTVWARRLNAWLTEAGTDLWAYLDIVDGVPVPAELEAAGIMRNSAAQLRS